MTARPPKPAAPPAPPPKAKERPPARLPPAPVRHAQYAMIGFTALTALTLVAYFARADEPWSFESFVALLSVLVGGGAAAQLWRQPTRTHALASLAVLGFSLLRVGLPTQWGWGTITVFVITALFAAPVARAVMILPRT